MHTIQFVKLAEEFEKMIVSGCGLGEVAPLNSPVFILDKTPNSELCRAGGALDIGLKLNQVCAFCEETWKVPVGAVKSEEAKTLENIALDYFKKRVILAEEISCGDTSISITADVGRCYQLLNTVVLCENCIAQFCESEATILKAQENYLEKMSGSKEFSDMLADPWLDLKRFAYSKLKSQQLSIKEELRLIEKYVLNPSLNSKSNRTGGLVLHDKALSAAESPFSDSFTSQHPVNTGIRADQTSSSCQFDVSADVSDAESCTTNITLIVPRGAHGKGNKRDTISNTKGKRNVSPKKTKRTSDRNSLSPSPNAKRSKVINQESSSVAASTPPPEVYAKKSAPVRPPPSPLSKKKEGKPTAATPPVPASTSRKSLATPRPSTPKDNPMNKPFRKSATLALADPAAETRKSENKPDSNKKDAKDKEDGSSSNTAAKAAKERSTNGKPVSKQPPRARRTSSNNDIHLKIIRLGGRTFTIKSDSSSSDDEDDSDVSGASAFGSDRD